MESCIPLLAPPGTPVELQSLSFFRLVGIYVPAMVKGLSPLFAVPMLIGLWGWRRVWARRDHQPLFYTALVVMAAAWIHAWCGRESCDRYYLPIVLMASPFAALGLLAICRRFLLWSERFRAQHAVLPIGRGGARGDRPVGQRGHRLLEATTTAAPPKSKLAEWMRREYGPSPKLFGSEGITPVIAYYSGAQYATLTKAMDDRTVLDSAREIRPDAILILATRRKDLHETRRLIDELCETRFPRNRTQPIAAGNR